MGSEEDRLVDMSQEPGFATRQHKEVLEVVATAGALDLDKVGVMIQG